MKYISINIDNFRGIKKIEIEDLKRINVLVGRNNCGKTTILESIFLLSGMSNPQLPVNIHNFRDLILSEDKDFNFMFHNMDFTFPVKINGQIDNRKRSLSINPIFVDYNPKTSEKIKQTEISNNETVSSSTDFVRLIEGIRLEFKNYQNKNFNSQISIKEGKIRVDGKYKEELKCSFLNPKTILQTDVKSMENLIVQKKMNPIIKILKQIELNLLDIRMVGSTLYVDIGQNKLLPLNIMGDGMRRILSILIAIQNMENGIILIDEIENGLHYTSLSILWKALLLATKEFNVQIITTTHSYECIEAFSKSYMEEEPEGDDIRLYRIDKRENTHYAYKLTTKSIIAGIEKEFEVR
ncbi:MAG TPA: hypothetical protein DHW82_02570 [Spirochaetia bacterium]|nr:MAG: hypothetical protein A2Y41_10440 [Spirochaetes bacterium GWB1_36_13]HCL55875.1 hypothetical protein [Spirochaetia bacterium]